MIKECINILISGGSFYNHLLHSYEDNQYEEEKKHNAKKRKTRLLPDKAILACAMRTLHQTTVTKQIYNLKDVVIQIMQMFQNQYYDFYQACIY